MLTASSTFKHQSPPSPKPHQLPQNRTSLHPHLRASPETFENPNATPTDSFATSELKTTEIRANKSRVSGLQGKGTRIYTEPKPRLCVSIGLTKSARISTHEASLYRRHSLTRSNGLSFKPLCQLLDPTHEEMVALYEKVNYEKLYPVKCLARWDASRAKLHRWLRVFGGGAHKGGRRTARNKGRGGHMFDPGKIWQRWRDRTKQKRYALVSIRTTSGNSSVVMTRDRSLEVVPKGTLVILESTEGDAKTLAMIRTWKHPRVLSKTEEISISPCLPNQPMIKAKITLHRGNISTLTSSMGNNKTLGGEIIEKNWDGKKVFFVNINSLYYEENISSLRSLVIRFPCSSIKEFSLVILVILVILAIKKLETLSLRTEGGFQNELQILGGLRSSFLVVLLGYCVKKSIRIPTYEYRPERNLQGSLSENGDLSSDKEIGSDHGGMSFLSQRDFLGQLSKGQMGKLYYYDGLCKLKHENLKFKVCKGTSIQKTLVHETKSYSTTKIIVETSKGHHKTLLSTSVTKYYAKELPNDCGILIVNNIKVGFTREGSFTNYYDPQKIQDCPRYGFLDTLSLTMNKSSTIQSSSAVNMVLKETIQGWNHSQSLEQSFPKTVLGSGQESSSQRNFYNLPPVLPGVYGCPNERPDLTDLPFFTFMGLLQGLFRTTSPRYISALSLKTRIIKGDGMIRA